MPVRRSVPAQSRSLRAGLSSLVVCLVLAALAASGCGFPADVGGGQRGPRRGGEGPGHREQRLALSPQKELELGRQAYREILGDPQKYGRVLPADDPAVRRVREITRKIIRAAGIEPLQREINLRPGYRFEWEVNVFDKNEVNAFCLPGGKVGVFKGILKVAQNDDQVATVISHEIAHALAHHASERLARQGVTRGLPGYFLGKAHDRAEESEADHIGLFLMTLAGYNPEEAVRFWQRMQQIAGDRKMPEILSDHPSDARRIADMRKWVNNARAAKRAFDAGRIDRDPRR